MDVPGIQDRDYLLFPRMSLWFSVPSTGVPEFMRCLLIWFEVTTRLVELVRTFREFVRAFGVKYCMEYDCERGVRMRVLSSPEGVDMLIFKSCCP